MMVKTERMRNACEAAVTAFSKLKMDEYNDLQSKLQYCIGSYDFDKNPTGLIEYGKTALDELKAVKEKYPRKINKKIITDLEKYLQN
jgi:hypothetical protein